MIGLRAHKETPARPEAEQRWVTIAEAAEAAGVPTTIVHKWYRTGAIGSEGPTGGAFMVPLAAVVDLASRLGQDDNTDLDAVYWAAEAERARLEVIDLESQVAQLTDRLEALELLVTSRDAAAAPGYRGALRPQARRKSDSPAPARRPIPAAASGFGRDQAPPAPPHAPFGDDIVPA